MATVRFGNPSVHEPVIEAGVVKGAVPRPEIGKRVTVVELADQMAERVSAAATQLDEALKTFSPAAFAIYLVTENPLQPWEIALKHITLCLADWARAGADWIECEDPALRAVLAKLFDCSAGEQEGYGQEEEPENRDAETPAPELPPLAGGSAELDRIPIGMRDLVELEMRRWPGILAGLDGELTALKTETGFEYFAKYLFSTEGIPFKYMAVSVNATAPSETNTSLAEEVTTASGGLLRQAASYSYSFGSKTGKGVLKATFEMKTKDVEAGTKKLHKFGLFNKSVSGGQMGVETEITVAELAVEGDNVTITDTIELK